MNSCGLHVALINGFPYGWFHGRKLKDQVFAPDWQTPERAEYTIRLIRILSRLLPEGMDDGVSTCPLSYKLWFEPQQEPNWDLIVHHLLRTLEVMLEVKKARCQLIHLDIEPEPDGLIENAAEFVEFFKSFASDGNSPSLAFSLPPVSNRSRDSASRALHDLLRSLPLCR